MGGAASAHRHPGFRCCSECRVISRLAVNISASVRFEAMIADSMSFKGHRCFKGDWAGFESIKPINVIIGRNNTGKSHLVDLAAALCSENLTNRGWKYRCVGALDARSLQSVFNLNTSAGHLGGQHWQDHGEKFVDVRVAWELDESGNASIPTFPDGFNPASPWGERSSAMRLAMLQQILTNLRHTLFGTTFRRLLADRDIGPETPSNEMKLSPAGVGATNIIRRYIVTSNPKFPREVIQRDLLSALNDIFGQDGQFSEVQVKHHDEANGDIPEGRWEVFLGEEKKGLISLSNSGSGLKTVILVLLNLLVIPQIEQKPCSRFTFAFEELENNLHPALLRRLFKFLEVYAIKQKAAVFLTTHSSTALDVFGASTNAQIIRVSHDGETARAEPVAAHFDKLGVVSELGAKPSDLLQANGPIWVEGPSDCVYLSRWLEVYTDGALRDGRDYLCAFYGGALLARTQFASPEDAEAELINLFRVNANIVVVCDGDRSSAGAHLKDRVERIQREVAKIAGAYSWITSAREIENYLPGTALSQATGVKGLPDPDQYETFFPKKGKDSSFVEAKMNRKGIDKMELAVSVAPYLTKENMSPRFDWDAHMKQIVERINFWNR
jgi:putative ATP-dependent endonuclease of the OLD family